MSGISQRAAEAVARAVQEGRRTVSVDWNHVAGELWATITALSAVYAVVLTGLTWIERHLP